MAKQGISTGSSPNSGTGDTLVTGAIKINSNFDEIYNAIGNGTNINIGIGGTIITTTYSGSVGIGSTLPTRRLDIQGGDLMVGINTSTGLILTSQNGTKFRIFVSNSGVLGSQLV
jgi:hypothetical protein